MVFAALKRVGWFAQIVDSCCNGCASAEIPQGFPNYLWAIPVQEKRSLEPTYFNHQGDSALAVALLRAAGLEVEWDGGDVKSAIKIHGIHVPTSACEILAVRVA